MWRARQWRLLLNLIDHLPRHSAYVEALADDDEVASQLVVTTGQRVERLSEWTPEREMLANIFDRLGNLVAILIAANGGTPPVINPHPRPVTAAQRLAQMSSRHRHDRLNERLYAGRA